MIPIQFELDGELIPSPKIGGMGNRPQIIWSKNTNRTASTRMVGTIKAIKRTYELSWPPLPWWEAERLESMICTTARSFHFLRWTGPDGSARELECYFSNPSFDQYDTIAGLRYCTNGKVAAIER